MVTTKMNMVAIMTRMTTLSTGMATTIKGE
jgi:hypothetical protein